MSELNDQWRGAIAEAKRAAPLPILIKRENIHLKDNGKAPECPWCGGRDKFNISKNASGDLESA